MKLTKLLIMGCIVYTGIPSLTYAQSCQAVGKVDNKQACIIFLTDPEPSAGSLAGMDNYCNSYAQNNYPDYVNAPNNITFKAFLSGNSPTKLGVKYYRGTDGTTLISQASGSYLSAVLDNSITDVSTQIWTGISSSDTFTTFSSYQANCNFWTGVNSVGGYIGDASYSNQTGINKWFYINGSWCDYSHSVICVAQ